ncbi:hypothetical protein GCM10009416_17100 [Craurococcus roseus]|uniref:PDZ domain-containing protein n=1 Tax=Craurococcus roseus TaxID=77585 RepID=A0ABN1F0J8_9PROT
MKRTSVLLAAALGLPACATITTGTTQNLSVASEPPGASCRLQRGGELVGMAGPAQSTVQVSKSMRDIAVECSQPGYQNASGRIPAGFQPLFLGNILLGGVVGMVVDMASGAASTYPASTTVAMGAAGPDPSPAGAGAQELPHIASRTPGARRPYHTLAAESAIRPVAAAASASNAEARRKLLVRVDHLPAEAGSPDPRAVRGLVVLDVLPGGVGSSADLRPGDVIVALDGAPVATVEDMRYKLGTVEANRTVIATVRRDGRDRLAPLRF